MIKKIYHIEYIAEKENNYWGFKMLQSTQKYWFPTQVLQAGFANSIWKYRMASAAAY